jgi:ubiquinone/menaquinone biosynthesis C-methylase UbiE
VADVYNKRYETAYKQNGIASKLLDLVRTAKVRRVLEVGCGTGHWLSVLRGYALAVGMDLSYGMLQKAANANRESLLVQGEANRLSFADQTFNMVFCVNAVHHFGNPSAFVAEAHRVLMPDGVLVVIGMNPHARKDRWFIYNYFPGTREADLKRYPSPETIADWMISAGLEEVTHQVGERIQDERGIDDVLPLAKDFTSQLSLLTSEDYEKGIARIEAALQLTYLCTWLKDG